MGDSLSEFDFGDGGRSSRSPRLFLGSRHTFGLMKIFRRSLVFGLLVFGLGLAPGLVASAQQQGTAPTNPNASALKECSQENRSLSILFLIDASQSLKTEDPLALRSVGIELAIDAVSRQVEAEAQADRPFDLYLDFLLFGTSTRRAFPGVWPEWGQLREGGMPQDLRSAIRGLGNQSNDADTDYLSALDPWLGRPRPTNDPRVGALEVLKQAPSESCQLLVWFTDGRFDFDPPGPGAKSPKTLTWTDSSIRNQDDAKEVRDEGYAAICQDNGPIDALRSGEVSDGTGTELAVVALGDPNRFGFFDRLVRNSEGNCGSGQPRGTVYSAESIDQLIFQLIQAVVGDVTISDPTDTCTTEYRAGDSLNDDECHLRFNVTPGIGSFDLLVLRGSKTVRAQLIDPDGRPIDLVNVRPTATMSNGTRLEASQIASIENLIPIHAELSDSPNDWAGTWTLRFWSNLESDREAINQSLVFVFQGELSARIREEGVVLRRGTLNKFVVELISADGALVSQESVSPTIDLRLAIDGKAVDVGPLRSDGTWEVSYEVDEEFRENSVAIEAELVASVSVRDGDPSVEIGRWSNINLGSLSVREIPKYPLVDRPVSKFSNALSQRDSKATATLEVVAPEDEGGGCVSLVSVSTLVSPDGLRTGVLRVLYGDQELSIGDECSVRLDDGQSAVLTLEATTEEGNFAVDDSVAGTIVLRSTSEIDPNQSEEFSKDVVVSVAPSLIVSPDYTRAFLLALAALLLAISVLYLLSWYDARVDLGSSSLVMIPVTFRNGRLYRRDEVGETDFGYRDEEVDRFTLPGPGKYRRIRTKSVEFRGRMSRSPFGDVSGTAVSPQGLRVASMSGSSSDGRAGLLSASLLRAWAFSFRDAPVRQPDGINDVHGDLTLIIDDDFTQAREDVRQMVSDLEQSLRVTLSSLAVDEVPLAKETDRDSTPVYQGVDPEEQGDEEEKTQRRSERRREKRRDNRADDSSLVDEDESDIDDPY